MTPIEYRVSLKAPQTQMADVCMVVREIKETSIDVALPVWRPGKYAVINPAGTIHGMQARDAAGTPLQAVKVDKTTWRIQTAGAPEVEITYRIYANSLADRTRHIDDTHAFLSGSAVFLYV